MATRDPQRIRAETAAVATNRGPLSKRAWRDVRRACALNASGGVRFVEIHGVKITFNWGSNAINPIATGSTGTSESRAPTQPTPRQHARATSEAPAAAPSGDPPAPRGNARQRRSRTRLQEFLQRKRDAAEASNQTGQVAAAVDATDAAMNES